MRIWNGREVSCWLWRKMFTVLWSRILQTRALSEIRTYAISHLWSHDQDNRKPFLIPRQSIDNTAPNHDWTLADDRRIPKYVKILRFWKKILFASNFFDFNFCDKIPTEAKKRTCREHVLLSQKKSFIHFVHTSVSLKSTVFSFRAKIFKRRMCFLFVGTFCLD